MTGLTECVRLESENKDGDCYESGSTSPTLSPSEDDIHQDDISDDNHDMEEEAIAEVDSEVLDFEQRELDHDAAFALQKIVSCFVHTLQLVVCKFDTLKKPKRVLARAHQMVSKVLKLTKAK